MGVFQNFPYLEWQKLNVDWVLEICHKAEHLFKHLDITIEDIVRPMLQEQLNSIESLYNSLKFYVNQQVNNMQTSNKKLQDRVNLQLNNNLQEMYKLKSDVNASNQKTLTQMEIAISEIRAETKNLIAKYNSIWGAMSATQQAQINKIIQDFTIEYNKQLANNLAKMEQLEFYVNSQIQNMQNSLNNTAFKLQQEMQKLKLDTQQDMLNVVDVLKETSATLLLQLEKQAVDVDNYFYRTQDLINNMFNLLEMDIRQKADLKYVDAQLADIRTQIRVCNSNIEVINPTTSKPDTLQNTLQDIYQNVNPWSITAGEYDELRITAECYDWISANFMTAQDYDEAGKFYLKIWVKMYNKIKDVLQAELNKSTAALQTQFNALDQREALHFKQMQDCCKNVNNLLQKELYMYSPVSGKRLSLKDVILELIGVIQTDAITAGEYDALMLKVKDYDNKLITAFDYDWHGKTILGG